ncbi:hypothetical protein GLAREA_02637 [Glarea lozoyensis ATCC 20868]|uniref:Uncharacterized protein n=1 Tax=Glarea lozoyensis (strain ATCC 20868 / MF5171) TaxID=1116229 RepID=S3DJK0_GLAL2|nr:uncharacterized protein GLAREA_02637 [Glarea lozoyensis ATCC 20868]EPE26723.1 hypothetical protein GLAREA_02637 [Glarea lozoyensis ATCC 20868]
MDPVSILSIVSSVVYVVKTCIEIYQEFSDFRDSRKETVVGSYEVEKEEDKLSQAIKACGPAVQKEYNRLAGRFGTMFAPNGDKEFKRQCKLIAKRQRKLLDGVKSLKSSGSQNSQYVKKMKILTIEATSIHQAMTNAINQLAKSGPAVNLPSGLPSSDTTGPLKALARPRAFCYGALLLQNNSAFTGAELAVDASMFLLGFTCKYCNLEVGDYRMSETGKTLLSTRVLARSHITSCASLMDRRAFYKCLACFAKHGDVDFGSAEALEKHLETHPKREEVTSFLEGEDLTAELNLSEEEIASVPVDVDEDDASKSLEEKLQTVDREYQLETEAARPIQVQASPIVRKEPPEQPVTPRRKSPAQAELANNYLGRPVGGMDVPSPTGVDDYSNTSDLDRYIEYNGYHPADQPASSQAASGDRSPQPSPQFPSPGYQQPRMDDRANSLRGPGRQQLSPHLRTDGGTFSFTASTQPYVTNTAPYGMQPTTYSSFASEAAQGSGSFENSRQAQVPNANLNNLEDGYYAPKKDKESTAKKGFFSSGNKDKRYR